MSDHKSLERALDLVQTLYRRTLDGKVDWRESDDPHLFWTEFGEFNLHIQLTPDKDYPDSPDYALHVVNRDTGRTIETISNVTLRPLMDRRTADGLNPYGVLSELYEMARRRALRVDDVLENLLESLRSAD